GHLHSFPRHEDLLAAPGLTIAFNDTTGRKLPFFVVRIVVLGWKDSVRVLTEFDALCRANDRRSLVEKGDVDRRDVSRGSHLPRHESPHGLRRPPPPISPSLDARTGSPNDRGRQDSGPRTIARPGSPP